VLESGRRRRFGNTRGSAVIVCKGTRAGLMLSPARLYAYANQTICRARCLFHRPAGVVGAQDASLANNWTLVVLVVAGRVFHARARILGHSNAMTSTQGPLSCAPARELLCDYKRDRRRRVAGRGWVRCVDKLGSGDMRERSRSSSSACWRGSQASWPRSPTGGHLFRLRPCWCEEKSQLGRPRRKN
jgi:hypothetical protein